MGRIVWYAELTWDYVWQMLPCALGAALVLLALMPWRRSRLASRGFRSPLRREAALFCFTAFCGGLAALTLFPANFWSTVLSGELPAFAVQYNGGFFWEITILRDLLGGPWVFFLLLGNVAMFLPLGLFPPLLWEGGRWWKSGLTGLCASTAVELVQLFNGRRSDINDILLNTCGALCGYGLFWLLRRLAPGWVEKFRCVKV